MNKKGASQVSKQYVTIIQFEQFSNGSSIYFAFHPELPGCMSDGESPEAARANLAKARQVYLEHLRENHLPIPEPKPLLGETVLPSPPVQEMSHEDKCSQPGLVFQPA